MTQATIEPYASGMLDVGDGQRVFWCESGNPDGKPALILHGGPGSGSSPAARRHFDPNAYRIVQFDQRGSGRSTPHASVPDVDMSANTTEHLLGDIERLRRDRGIDRWLLWGGSWGVTLGLAYAQRHPERVSEMVLVSVTMTRPADVEWLTRGVAMFFPQEWERFADGVPSAEREGNLAAAYARLLQDPDPAVHQQAADSWCEWEEVLVSLEGDGAPNPRYADPAFRLGFARTVTHYFGHAAWLADGQLLKNADRLARIPGVLIHGQFDLQGPLLTAWELARAWPAAELHVTRAGHTGGEETRLLIRAATDRFRD